MKLIANIEQTSEQTWLELRRSGIGASEVAGVMGLSPWQTPLSIYVEKIEGAEVRAESLPMEIGKELEPFMRRKFLHWLANNEQINPLEVSFEPKATYAHDDYPFIRCSPDDLFHHPVKGLSGGEYKTASEFKAGEFTDQEVPDQYYLQCQACMFVTGLREWYLAYLIGNRKFEVLLIPRNESVINDIKDSCNYFWNNNILTRTPPAPTGDSVDTKALKYLYSGGQDQIELLKLENTYDELKKLEATKKHMDKQIQEYKNQIMAEMGDHDEAILGYKEDGKPKKTTWKQMADVEVKAHVRKGSRVLRVY